MTPSGAFESEGWKEAQERISRALDKLRADWKQQHELTRHVAEHTQEALECGATREQIADALDKSEHASPEDAGDMAARPGSIMTVQLPDADRAAIQSEIPHP